MASSRSSGNSDENNDSTDKKSSPSKKSTPSKKRGITKMKVVTKMKDSGKKFPVQWNKKDQPIKNNHARLSSYIGHCARNRVAISCHSWKAVPIELKKLIVEQVMQSFDIPNDKGKIGWIITTANTAFRDFKSRLDKKYMRKNGEICTEPPAEYEFIDKSTWTEFIKYRQSDEFQALRARNSKIAKKNEYPYKAGRKGYAGIEQEIIEETNMEPSDEVSRGILWKKARVDIDGGLSGNVQEVAKKIDEIDGQVASGKLKLSDRQDSLSIALGKDEHPGRVTGVGKGVGIKDYFGASKRRTSSTKCSACSSPNELEAEVQTLRKVVLFLAKQQNINLDSIDGIHDIQLKIPSVSVEIPVIDKPTETVPTQEEHVDIINGETHSKNVVDHTEDVIGEDNSIESQSNSAKEQSPSPAELKGKWDKCQLFWPDLKRLVATGTMFIPSSSTMEISLHCRPLPALCMKVNIDSPVDPDSPLPFPMDEVPNVRLAIGIPIAWPKRLILPFKASRPPNKRKSSEVNLSKQIIRGVAATEGQLKQPSFKSIKKMKILVPGMDSNDAVASIAMPKTVVGHVHSILLWRRDIERWLDKEMIDGHHVSIYMKYLLENRCPENLPLFGFLCPQRIAADSGLKKEERARYICNSMIGEESRHFKLFLAPYYNDAHWMLAAINPRDDTVYWLDSLLGSVRMEFKEVIEMAMTMYFTETKKNKSKKNTRWVVVKGPRQPNNIECGYYVLRNMREIIDQRAVLVPIEHFTRLDSPYMTFQIDEVREEWLEFVEKHLVW